jgi:glycosyltransferase involved in cell wall biosynthesis
LVYSQTPALAPLALRAKALGAAVQPVPPISNSPGDLRYLPGLVGELRRARPSVFHAHLSWPFAAKYALAAAILARVPAVVMTVQLIPDSRTRRTTAVQGRLIAARVGRCIAVSQDIAKRLTDSLHWRADKIEVIHNAVQTERFGRPADPTLRASLGGGDSAIVLTVARLDSQKGHDVLLRAVAETPSVRLVLAGQGPERERLETLVSRLGLSARVLFLGRRTDVAELLAASDVFVLPSLFEGSSLAVLEAMAAMKPVVATAIGGTDELIVDGESGRLVPPADPGALAAALRQVIADRPLRTRLGQNARDRVEQHFSAAGMAKRVAQVYESLLRARGTS